jgi:hypothetical protein
MKTEEDEAFEDIERRQGGFCAKRQAAMDKINSDFDEEYIKYREVSPKGYLSPLKREWVGLTDEEQLQVIHANASTGLWLMAKDIEAKLKQKNYINDN